MTSSAQPVETVRAYTLDVNDSNPFVSQDSGYLVDYSSRSKGVAEEWLQAAVGSPQRQAEDPDPVDHLLGGQVARPPVRYNNGRAAALREPARELGYQFLDAAEM